MLKWKSVKNVETKFYNFPTIISVLNFSIFYICHLKIKIKF